MTDPAVASPTNIASLLATIKASKPGQIINIAPGDYAGLNLTNLNLGGITLTTQPTATGLRARLENFTFNGCSGITLTNLDLSATGSSTDQSGCYKINGCSNIHFVNVKVHGPGSTIQDIATAPGLGINLSNSTNISVTGSEFTQLVRGINIWGCEAVVISENNFHRIRSDGIDGQQSGNVLIQNNKFTDFFPVGNFNAQGTWVSGDHPDAIQFWTANTKSPSHDLIIKNNVVVRGGGSIFQGVFVTDQNDYLIDNENAKRKAAGLLPISTAADALAVDPTLYKNVSVINNLMVGSNANAIDVSGCDTAVIRDNQICYFPDQVAWVRDDHLFGNSVVSNNTAKKVTDLGVAAIAAWKPEV